MTRHANLHVVAGAGGAVGSAVVRQLVDRGHEVRAVGRHALTNAPDGVEIMASDLSDPADSRRACAGAAVVYHCAQPGYTNWPERFPALTAAIADGAAAAGAKLVFADNLYSYGPVDGPLHEQLPFLATGKKGRVREQMATRLMEAHASGRLRVAIGRPSDYYGPGGLGSAAGAPLFLAACKGKRVRWLGSLDQLHTLHYLDDIARGLVTLGERDESEGEVWHLPAAEALTGRQFLDLVFRALGKEPKIGTTSRAMVRMAGVFVPLIREVRETMYQWERPWVVDDSKFQNAFGPFDATPHETAIKPTVAWFSDLVSKTPT